MTWSYSGDPSNSDKDLYRFEIGDTDPTEPIISDEEILYILSQNTDRYRILYKLFTAAANIFSRSFKRSLGPQAEDPTSRSRYFSDQMLYYRKLACISGLPSISSNSDSIIKGVTDNPLAIDAIAVINGIAVSSNTVVGGINNA